MNNVRLANVDMPNSVQRTMTMFADARWSTCRRETTSTTNDADKPRSCCHGQTVMAVAAVAAKKE
jgi:hypothetical protein